MKLYQTPGGTFAGTEKAYAAAMKAEGSDIKAQTLKQVDVPVDKPGLMEFLTFHNVNVINPQGTASAPQVIDSGAAPSAPLSVAPTTMPTLDELFDAAPLKVKIELGVRAFDALDKTL